MNDFEEPAGYVPGGYHPVHLGDKFGNGRYEIVHKLGHGIASTVWLAQDNQSEIWVAIKILTANRSEQDTKPGELDCMKRMSRGSCDHPGFRHVVHLLNSFHVTGPNGQHLCLVMEFLSHEINYLRVDNDWNMPLAIAREAAKQLLLSIDFIHSCGVVHGDLHPGNILVRTRSTWSWDKEFEVSTWSSDPKVTKLDNNGTITDVSLLVNLPEYYVSPLKHTSGLALDRIDLEIVITDFSEATLIGNPTSKWAGAYALRPPEGIGRLNITPSADIWTWACVAWEFLGELPLFRTWPQTTDKMWDFLEVVGPLPPHLQERCPQVRENLASDVVNEDTTPIDPFFGAHSLDDRKQFMKINRKDFPDDELDAVVELLRDILVYDPNARLTPNQILESSWMKNWVLRGNFIMKRDTTQWRELHMKLPTHDYIWPGKPVT